MTIGQRLREFGIKKYGSIKEFAEALNMKPPSLQTYLRDKSKPGSELLYKLSKMGCDLHWLLAGETSKEKIQSEINEVWDHLKVLGIRNQKDLEALFNEEEYVAFAQDIINRAKEKQLKQKKRYKKSKGEK